MPVRRESVVLWLLTILLAIDGFAVPAMGAEQRFESWLATCDENDYCGATAETAAGDVLRIGRHAMETYWEISFTPAVTMTDPSAVPVRVSVDAETEVFETLEEIGPYGAENDYFLLGPKAQAVMDRLAPGTRISFDFEDQDAVAHRGEFTLTGLNDALIWIDGQQGRLGAERVAEASPVGLSPPGEPQIPETLLAQHAADTECEPMDELVNGRDIEVDPALDESKGLYFLPCWGAAYNFGWKAYVELFEGQFAVVALPEYSPARGWSATTHLVNYAYDPEAKTISTFNKGRGMADCGTSGTWQWGEYQFELIEFSAKAECDDGDPGDFPVVYRREEAQPAP